MPAALGYGDRACLRLEPTSTMPHIDMNSFQVSRTTQNSKHT